MTRDPQAEPARQAPELDGEIFAELFGRFWDGTVSPEQTRQQVGVIERELRLAAGDPVLVLPAGAGRLALALADRGYAVLGMDRSRDAVDCCALLAARAGSTAEFRCADLAEAGRYRVAAAVCLGWPGPPGPLTTWLAEALTTGARALIDIGGAGAWDGWADAFAKVGIVPVGHCADLWGVDGDEARRVIVAVRS